MADSGKGSEIALGDSSPVPFKWLVGGAVFGLSTFVAVVGIFVRVWFFQTDQAKVTEQQALAELEWRKDVTHGIELLTTQVRANNNEIQTLKKEMENTNKKSPYDWKRDQMGRWSTDAEKLHQQPFPDPWDPKYDRKE